MTLPNDSTDTVIVSSLCDALDDKSCMHKPAQDSQDTDDAYHIGYRQCLKQIEQIYYGRAEDGVSFSAAKTKADLRKFVKDSKKTYRLFVEQVKVSGPAKPHDQYGVEQAYMTAIHDFATALRPITYYPADKFKTELEQFFHQAGQPMTHQAQDDAQANSCITKRQPV